MINRFIFVVRPVGGVFGGLSWFTLLCGDCPWDDE